MELTSDELEAIINRAAAAGAQVAYAQAKKQGTEKADRYNDTFAVMKNYKDARFCLEHTVDQATKLNASLKMRHIDAALKVMQERREAQNRGIEYEAFRLYFLEGLSYETIAEKLDTSKNTPRRWITGILSELSTLLWGLDSDL